MRQRKRSTPVALLVSCAALLPLAGGESGWIELLKGPGLESWRPETGQWRVVGDVFLRGDDDRYLAWKEGRGAVVNGGRGRTVHLVSKLLHGDCEAHIEFMVSRGSNSGVYFMGRYEIQILDSWDSKAQKPKAKVSFGDCGGIYQRWERGRGFEGRAPGVNAALPPGKWQSFDVVFQAPRFSSKGKKIANARFVRVVHNGIAIHENEEVSGPTRAAMFNDEKPLGPLMLQGDHGPVAYRNIRIKLLPVFRAEELVPDSFLAAVKSYTWGKSRKELTAFEEKLRSLPLTALASVEKRLVAVLADRSATPVGKRYVLRLLRRVGSKACVGAVAGYLTDPELSHAARILLEGLRAESVNEELRKAAAFARQDLCIGIINTLGERRDAGAVTLLQRFLASRKRALVGPSIRALGKIGTVEAAGVLLGAQVPSQLRDLYGDSLLECAAHLRAQGEETRAGKLLEKVLSGDFSPELRKAAKRAAR